MAKVLFLGAHPDDIDLGCGISMHDHYLRGDDITAVVLTNGEKGGDPSIRLYEQNNSFDLLAPGLNKVFLNFPDTRLFTCMDEIIEKIGTIFPEVYPDSVYIPTRQDFHQDHVATHDCAMVLINQIGVGRVLSYETPSTIPAFSPNFYKLCGLDQFRLKIDALRCHESQSCKPYFSEEVIYSIAKMRAVQCRYYQGVAEAYDVVRLTEF